MHKQYWPRLTEPRTLVETPLTLGWVHWNVSLYPSDVKQAPQTSQDEAGPGQDGVSGPWANFEGAGMFCPGRGKVIPGQLSPALIQGNPGGQDGMFGLTKDEMRGANIA